MATLALTTPGPLLEFVRTAKPKSRKNRLHLDVRPYLDDNQAAEVERLIGLGAFRVDVGQSAEAIWTVLSDVEGNEFCVLSPGGKEMLSALAVDCADPARLASWWGEALQWEVSFEGWGYTVQPPAGEPGLQLDFAAVPEVKSVWNRVHFDLASQTDEHQAEIVSRLQQKGAKRLDIDRPWVVLKDPEGNEFCVLEPWDGYDGRGNIASVTIKARKQAKLAAFWQQVVGGGIMAGSGMVAALDLPTPGPLLQFLHSDEVKTVKNRLHLDVRPLPGGDQQAEVERLLDLGAVRFDEQPEWTVLQDPEGNEFCVLMPL